MAANGQKLRVAVTKTSAQGKAAQSATPNLMSFSTDENSIWFNGKKYGATLFKNVFGLSTSSSNSQITAALGGYAFSTISSMVNEGILFLNINNKALQHVMIRVENTGSSEGDYLHIQGFSDASDTAYIKIRHYNGVFNVPRAAQRNNIVFRTDIMDEFAPLSDYPLSANMGMKLNDEKLDKKDVVNNLTSTDATKALSAAQGKKLNDQIINIKIKIFESLSSKTEGEDVTDIVGKLTDDWNLHPEEYIFYIRDDSELCIAPCTVYYEAEMRYLSYQVNGTIYEYDCEYNNDICNLVGIYTFHATPD
mgnify:FL=1